LEGILRETMVDSIFNIIIVLIPMAVLIGRLVLQAQAKRRPGTPPKKQPPIPVHFEDYDDEEERQFVPSAVPTSEITQRDSVDAHSSLISMESEPDPLPQRKAELPSGGEPRAFAARSVASSSGPAQFFLNLSHLAPMKQAVVLAEILGPPKGIE
jgi:hypothetical protein